MELNTILKRCPVCGLMKELTSNGYCFECRHDYFQEWREQHKGFYLYVILSGGHKVEYVGCTENINMRVSSHINGHSKNTRELMMTDKWECIKYLDITDLVQDRDEMLFLENALIDLYETELNKNKSIIKTVDKLRGFILLSEVHSLTHSWEVYCKNAHKKISFD